MPVYPGAQWVLSSPFRLRFLFASRPEIMSRVLGLVYRAIETHLIQQAGCTRGTARTGAITLIQRFSSALNLNVHFHILFLDGVYLTDREQPVFRRTAPGIGVELNESVALVYPYQDEPLHLQMQETPEAP